MVSWMTGEGVADQNGMAYAAIDSARIYKGYSDANHTKVGRRLSRIDRRSPVAHAPGAKRKKQ